MDTTKEKSKSFSRYVVFYSFIAAIGGFLFGYDTAVISGAIGFLKARFALEAGMQGWTVSSLIVGAAVGAVFAGSLSDKFGRKKLLVASSLLFSVGMLGSAFSTEITLLIVARIIGGLGLGVASAVSPLYIAEISPARIRGRMVSIYQFSLVTGIFITFFINAAIEGLGNDAWDVTTGWRWMFGCAAVPGIVYLFLLTLIPESPRWLMKRKQEVLALDILEKMNGKEAAKAELHEILNLKDHDAVSFKELLQPSLRLPFIIGVLLAILQQVTGINAIMYYAPEILKQTGANTDSALLQTVLVGVVNLAFTILALWVIDKAGRKVLLLGGAVVMTICLFAVGYAFQVGNVSGPIILFFILLYVAAFAVSFGPVVWVMISEIFPTRIRARATAVATLSLWVADFVVSQTFPMLLGSIGAAKTFWLYAALSFFAVYFCAKFIPETKGKSLEQVELLWAAKN